MSACKKIHTTLFLIGFIYLLLCPVVQDFDDNLRYDLVRKIGTRKTQNNFKKFTSPTPLQLPNHTQPACPFHSGKVRELLFYPSSYSSSNLSILSTVRLIL